jgi:hypothetical protein
MCCAVSHVMSVLAIHVCCIVLGALWTTMTWRASLFAVKFNGFISLMSSLTLCTLLTLQKPHIPASLNINLILESV